MIRLGRLGCLLRRLYRGKFCLSRCPLPLNDIGCTDRQHEDSNRAEYKDSFFHNQVAALILFYRCLWKLPRTRSIFKSDPTAAHHPKKARVCRPPKTVNVRSA